jgi:hypothetical protein
VTALAAFTQALSTTVYLGTDGYGVLLTTDGGDDWIRADAGAAPSSHHRRRAVGAPAAVVSRRRTPPRPPPAIIHPRYCWGISASGPRESGASAINIRELDRRAVAGRMEKGFGRRSSA